MRLVSNNQESLTKGHIANTNNQWGNTEAFPAHLKKSLAEIKANGWLDDALKDYK